MPTSSYSSGDGLMITLSTNGHDLEAIFGALEYALKGQGFYFKGEVGIVENE